jgi:hypothetical protein
MHDLSGTVVLKLPGPGPSRKAVHKRQGSVRAVGVLHRAGGWQLPEDLSSSSSGVVQEVHRFPRVRVDPDRPVALFPAKPFRSHPLNWKPPNRIKPLGNSGLLIKKRRKRAADLRGETSEGRGSRFAKTGGARVARARGGHHG